jgi:beta-glucanase (GH16 family)
LSLLLVVAAIALAVFFLQYRRLIPEVFPMQYPPNPFPNFPFVGGSYGLGGSGIMLVPPIAPPVVFNPGLVSLSGGGYQTQPQIAPQPAPIPVPVPVPPPVPDAPATVPATTQKAAAAATTVPATTQKAAAAAATTVPATTQKAAAAKTVPATTQKAAGAGVAAVPATTQKAAGAAATTVPATTQKTAVAGAAVPAGEPASPDPPTGKTFKVRWRDDFDGTTFDRTKWDFHLGNGVDYMGVPGWGNGEKQCYTDKPENISVDKSVLKITARVGGQCINPKSNAVVANPEFTSSRIASKEAFMWKGSPGSSQPILVSAKIKIPMADWSFVAFWLLPNTKEFNPSYTTGNGKYGNWCYSGEIDIIEHINKKTNLHSVIHYPKSKTNDQKTDCTSIQNVPPVPNNASMADWHIYSVLWDSTYIKFYFDNVMVKEIKMADWGNTGSESGNKYAPFDQPMNIIFNYAVGGNWTVSELKTQPDLNKDYPSNFEVDWVAVYDVL